MKRRQQIRKTLLLFLFLVFPVTFIFMSPYLMVLGASERVVSAGLLFWMLAFLLSFLIGRGFCGWFCPLGAEQMLVDQAVKKPLVRIRYLPLLRWVLWAAWAGVTLLLVVSAGGFLHVDPFFHVDGFPYAFTAYLIFYGILLGVFVVSLVLGKHAFCSYFCFFSPFMMIGTIVKNRLRYPSLHLEAEKELCNQCRRCNLECPRSLDVAGMVQEEELTGPECILCGACVDSCPKQAVRYGWRWG